MIDNPCKSNMSEPYAFRSLEDIVGRPLTATKAGLVLKSLRSQTVASLYIIDEPQARLS